MTFLFLLNFIYFVKLNVKSTLYNVVARSLLQKKTHPLDESSHMCPIATLTALYKRA